jgi:DNA-binding NtrC family response regulator
MQIRVAPLREHPDDIPELVAYFLSRLAMEWGRRVQLTAAALHRLEEYPWPGNVRQLRSVLENLVALSEKDVIEFNDIPLPASGCTSEPASLNLEELEAWAIRQGLRRTHGNMTQTARLLGISRETLASKVKRYSIRKEEAVELPAR